MKCKVCGKRATCKRSKQKSYKCWAKWGMCITHAKEAHPEEYPKNILAMGVINMNPQIDPSRLWRERMINCAICNERFYPRKRIDKLCHKDSCWRENKRRLARRYYTVMDPVKKAERNKNLCIMRATKTLEKYGYRVIKC